MFFKVDLHLDTSTKGKIWCFSNLETLAVFEPNPTGTHPPTRRPGDCFTIQKSWQRRSRLCEAAGSTVLALLVPPRTIPSLPGLSRGKEDRMFRLRSLPTGSFTPQPARFKYQRLGCRGC